MTGQLREFARQFAISLVTGVDVTAVMILLTWGHAL